MNVFITGAGGLGRRRDRRTRHRCPAMRARRAGRVINVSSVVGRFVLPGMGAYSAAARIASSAGPSG